MTLFQILLLAAVQGAAELLPVSSSAHVILAERLMRLDPSAPEMTFLLVMLHTGTMFAVLVYFWSRWKILLKTDAGRFIRSVAIATVATGTLGLILKLGIEKVILEKILGHNKGEIEALFRFLPLTAANLFLVGGLILYSARVSQRTQASSLSDKNSLIIGLVQAICLPLRGFSRSGATISTCLIRGVSRSLAEDFSFALAVILTPPVILLEARRLFKALPDATHAAMTQSQALSLLQPGMVGMFFSFIAGLLALKWLSQWLEKGKWNYFGYYCWIAAATVLTLHFTVLSGS